MHSCLRIWAWTGCWEHQKKEAMESNFSFLSFPFIRNINRKMALEDPSVLSQVMPSVAEHQPPPNIHREKSLDRSFFRLKRIRETCHHPRKLERRTKKDLNNEEKGWHTMRWLDHHRLNGCQFEKTPGDSGGQGCLACCNPWGRKELDTS